MRLGKGVPIIALLGGAASLWLGLRNRAVVPRQQPGPLGPLADPAQGKLHSGERRSRLPLSRQPAPRFPQGTPLPHPDHTAYY